MFDAETGFLDTLYRGVADDGEFQRALDQLRDMFRCRGAAFVSLDAQAPATDITLTSGVMREHIRLYAEQFCAIDPAPVIFSRLAVGTVASTDRLFSKQQLAQIPFFNEFFRPIGLVETLGGPLDTKQGRFSLVGLQRGVDRAQFDDDDIVALERLMPHISRALQLRRAVFQVEGRIRGLEAFADRLPTGLVLLGADGAALFVNAAMRTIAERNDGFALDRLGRPLALSLPARRRFDALLQDVNGGGAGGILTVPRADGAVDYVVLIAPAPSEQTDLPWRRRQPGAIVVVHDPTLRQPNAAEILEQGLHLSKGSARLLAALAADDDLKSFAQREGVTIHTARFHLHTALSRTGARTQAELLRIAVRLLRDFALSSAGS
jgi:DNA-binding CsgD family transcriptional regulator/PAS domain-containing protein